MPTFSVTTALSHVKPETSKPGSQPQHFLSPVLSLLTSPLPYSTQIDTLSLFSLWLYRKDFFGEMGEKCGYPPPGF